MAITYLSGERIQGSSAAVSYVNAGKFDGNDYCTIDGGSVGQHDIIAHNADFTISAWIRHSTLTEHITILDRSNDGDDLLRIQYHASSATYKNMVVMHFDAKSWYGNVAIPDDTWVHVVVSRGCSSSAITPKIYVNGVGGTSGVNTGISQGSSTCGADTGTGSLRIGNNVIGALLDLAVYDSQLSDAQVLAIYNGGKGNLTSVSSYATDLVAHYIMSSNFNDTAGSGYNATASGDANIGQVIDTSTDEKTTISNVPTGTRFEETDTRKIFNRREKTGSAGSGNYEWTEKDSTPSSILRGVMMGSYGVKSDVIQYVVIQTLGNATDFGNLTRVRGLAAGHASTDTGRGLCAGGYNDSGTYSPENQDIIDYIAVGAVGNAADFGDLALPRRGCAGCGSVTRMLVGGGIDSGNSNVIEYITIATPGDASDFGDLVLGGDNIGGASNDTRALFAGCHNGGATNTVSTVVIATAGNATDFGDLNQSVFGATGLADATRVVFAGGNNGSDVNTMQYMEIAATGSTTDFGDLTATKRNMGACADTTRGLFAGGYGYAVIDYITIQTTGNAADFGDLTNEVNNYGGTSACAA